MLRIALAAVLIATVVTTGCSSKQDSTELIYSPATTECVNPVELTEAIDLVLAAKNNPERVNVHGLAVSEGNGLLERLSYSTLAARQNPEGEGVIVSAVFSTEGRGARSYAQRAAWLVLDGFIYPINPDAAEAFNMLLDGYPPEIATRAGVKYSGLDDFGISENVGYNEDSKLDFELFVSEANHLCEPPAALPFVG